MVVGATHGTQTLDVEGEGITGETIVVLVLVGTDQGAHSVALTVVVRFFVAVAVVV